MFKLCVFTKWASKTVYAISLTHWDLKKKKFYWCNMVTFFIVILFFMQLPFKFKIGKYCVFVQEIILILDFLDFFFTKILQKHFLPLIPEINMGNT